MTSRKRPSTVRERFKTRSQGDCSKKEKASISIKKAVELTHSMHQTFYTLPESRHTKSKPLKIDDEQRELYVIIQKLLGCLIGENRKGDGR